jgi:hypothetical protein
MYVSHEEWKVIGAGKTGRRERKTHGMTRVDERVWKKKVAVRRFTSLMAFRCQLGRGELGGFSFARV